MSAERHQYVPDAMAMGDCRVCGHVEKSSNHLAIQPDDLAIGAHYRHKKTGGTYQLVMFAKIEATLTPAVVYAARSKDGLQCWVRPVDEFCDGRFEAVEMATVPFR